MEIISVKEATPVASSQPENSRLGIGRPIASHLPASSSSEPLLTPVLPRVGPWYNNDNSDPLDHSDRYSRSQLMISKAFSNILRSEPNLHDIDGACPWTLALEKGM